MIFDDLLQVFPDVSRDVFVRNPVYDFSDSTNQLAFIPQSVVGCLEDVQGLGFGMKRVGNRTRPDTRLPKSRVGGQGPYLRSPDHLGRSSEVKEIKS